MKFRPRSTVDTGPLYALAALLWCISATAQAVTNLDLADALRRTLDHNAELALYPFDRSRAEARLLQAGIRPAPQLSLTVENIAGSGPYEALDAAETTLALSQVIELGDKRDNRLQLARAQQNQLASEYELSRLDVLAETTRRFYQLLYIQELQQLNEQLIEQQQQALKVANERAQAGALAGAEVSKLDLRLARAQARRNQLQSDHELASTRLAAMWLAEVDFDTAAGQLGDIEAPAQSLINAAVSSAPQLQRQLALTRLADAELQMAQSGGRSDLTLSAGVRRFELSDETALVLSAAMPLNFSNPNRGRIAAAQHQQARSQRQQALIEQQLTLSLAELQQRLIHIQSQIQQLRTELLPRAQRLLDQTLSGYRRGRYSVLALTDAQSERFGLEQQLIELRRSAHLQLLELERITGAPLIATSTGEQP